MVRVAKFLVEYNGAKGSRLIMLDFFTHSELTTFTRNFLGPHRRPINAVGMSARVVFGIDDEIIHNPVRTGIR